MEHGERQNFCLDGFTLKQALGEEAVQKLQKYLFQNAAVSQKPFSDHLDHYLTHPEGGINDKREEPYDLVNMQGDSNTTKQRKRAPGNKKTNDYLSECMYNSMKCIGKIIHIDTIAQTEGVLETKNKSTGVFKKKNIYTHSKEKYDAEEIDPSRNIKYQKHSKQKKKLDFTCPCKENDLNEIDISENIQAKKSSKWLGKRRRRSRALRPRKINEDYEKDASNNIKCDKQCVDYTFNGVRTNEYEMNEISELPKKNKKVSRIRPQKEFKDNNICAKGICAKAFNEKRSFDCTCKKKPGASTSLINVKKIKSLLSCLYYNSKKSIRKILHKPVNNKPDAYKKDNKVAIKDKRDNSYEPDHQRKIENKKSPKQAEIREHAIDMNLSPEHKLTDFSQKDKGKPTVFCGSLNKAHIMPCLIKNQNLTKKTVKYDRVNKLPKNAGDQTGEPLIKIEVDAIQRCVLNPTEIRHKLKHLSQNNKGKPTCIYPSCNNRGEQYLLKNVCEGRVCQKMFKDKKTNFNCKCRHTIEETGGECTDRSCGSKIIKRKRNKCSTRCIQSPKINEPRLEVHLDAKDMCILNSADINQKIVEIEDEVCPGGTCAVARCQNRKLFKCKCVQKRPETTECSEETCVDEESPVDLLYYWMSKLTNKIPNNKTKRNPLDTNEITKIKSIFTFICDRLKRTSEIWDGSEAQNTRCALSGLKEQKQTVSKTNYHTRSGLNVPLKNSRRARRPSKVNQSPSTCKCKEELAKRKKLKGKTKNKQLNKEELKLRKKRLKQQNKINKKIAKQTKAELQEMKELSKHDEIGNTNCLADFFLGLLSVGIGISRCLLYALFRIIIYPKKSYIYAEECWKHPQHTYEKLHRWLTNRWKFQQFRMIRSMKGSRSMNIITDQVRESALYTAFADKGKTQKEKELYQAQSKRRQQRIRKRTKEAVGGCRDILLVTMRRTPCLWVYFLCPNFYPRFLGLRANFIKICELCLFCLAILVWTPCILCCELARGFVCCVTCQS